MNKPDPWELGWDIFTMLAGLGIPAVCFWLFLSEFPVSGARADTLNRISIGWLGAGTLGYAIVYCSLVFGYPESRQEHLRSWSGRIRMLSIGGLWVLYLLSLLLGPILIVSYAISGFRSFVRGPESKT